MKVIFDIDNTLIKWESNFSDCISMCGRFRDNQKDKIDEAIESFESKYDRYTREDMLEHIRISTGLNIEDDFVDKYIECLGIYAIKKPSAELISTLEYLSSKYTLCISSNWFSTAQDERLRNMGIRKYFSEFYYSGEYLSKPSPEMLLAARTSDDDIFIGDAESDRLAASRANMKFIDIKEIEFSNLKEML